MLDTVESNVEYSAVVMVIFFSAASILDEPFHGHVDGGLLVGADDDDGGAARRLLGHQVQISELPRASCSGSRSVYYQESVALFNRRRVGCLPTK